MDKKALEKKLNDKLNTDLKNGSPPPYVRSPETQRKTANYSAPTSPPGIDLFHIPSYILSAYFISSLNAWNSVS